MSSRLVTRITRAAAAAALLVLALTGCGQRGPLTLPDSARPIERLDPSARRGAPAGTRGAEPSSGGEAAAPPNGAAPAPQDGEEPKADRPPQQRTENER